MIKKIIVIIIALTINVSYGQGNKSKIERKVDNLTEQISELNRTVLILRDSIKNKSILTAELIKKQQLKNEILKERIQQASDTISNQNSLFDGFGVLYAIITVVIALIGVALPVLTYQFGIKPSQKALKDFENNADKKMEEFLLKSRNKQIEFAIENLKSGNQELKTNAVTYLSLTQHQGFSDQQLFKLVTILNSNKIDSVTKGTIAYTISNKKSDYATEYFKKTITDPNNVHVKNPAIQYFANVGIEDYLDVFRKLLSSSQDKYNEFNMLLFHTAHINKKAVITLINDKKLIDLLDKKSIDTLKPNLNNHKTPWQLSDKEVEKSYLNEIIKKASS